MKNLKCSLLIFLFALSLKSFSQQNSPVDYTI